VLPLGAFGAGIWDTCIHINFVPELGSRFH
jgi:hypothetical protein